MIPRRWWRWSGGGMVGVRACLCLAVCLGLATVRLPRSALLEADFPQYSPTTLAHFLADFSNLPKLYTHITGPWRVEEEFSNYTCWQYAVSYECGARCGGRATITHERASSAADAHRLLLADQRCQSLPLLPWPYLCEYSETETVITVRGGGGSRVRERTRVRCGALQLARGCDAAGPRRRLLRALRDMLAAETAAL